MPTREKIAKYIASKAETVAYSVAERLALDGVNPECIAELLGLASAMAICALPQDPKNPANRREMAERALRVMLKNFKQRGITPTNFDVSEWKPYALNVHWETDPSAKH